MTIITSAPTSQGDGRGLPPLVRQYLDRTLPLKGPEPQLVRITQRGNMWQTPGAAPRPFTAVQEIGVAEPFFVWRARFPVAPLVALHIVDSYRDGAGRMDGTVFGIPFLRRSGQEIAVGGAMRYLAELAWAPHAMLLNRCLAWREIDERTVEVSLPVGQTHTAVRMRFDDAGDIVESFAAARPRDGDVPRPWGGTSSNPVVLSGVRIPARAEVYWDLPTGRFTYFECEVESLELVGQA